MYHLVMEGMKRCYWSGVEWSVSASDVVDDAMSAEWVRLEFTRW